MLKKSLVTFLVALTFITGTAKVHAYSIEDAMVDISFLKTQIVDLKSQLSAAVITSKSDTIVPVATPTVVESIPPTTKATVTFTSPKNITPNTKGADVFTLQTALKEAGYFTASVTGNYGAVTEKAVKAFQKANNLPTTGVVGNLTKALLANPSNPPAPSQSCATTTAASWVKVLAPNGGETYIQGQQITVKWTTCSLLANNNMTIGIMNPAGAIVTVLTQSTPNDGVQTFTLPSTIQTGQYRVYVKTALTGTTYSDQSDNTFSVTASTLSSCNPNITTPSIKVISPNGGEVYIQDQNYQITVKWTTCNILASSNMIVGLTTPTGTVMLTQNTPNDGVETFSFPYTLIGQYKVYVKTALNNGTTYSDASDGLINIMSCNITKTLVTSSSSPSQYVAVGGTINAGSGNLLGSIDATVAKFNFSLPNGCPSETISQIGFFVFDNSVSSLRIGNTSVPVIMSSPGNGFALFNGLNIPIPSGGSGVNIDTFLSYPSISTNNAPVVSGFESRIQLTLLSYISNGVSYTNTATLGLPTSPIMLVVASKPTVTFNQPNTTLVNGLNEVANIIFNTDTHGYLQINSISILRNAISASYNSAPNTIVVKDQAGAVVPVTDTGGSSPVITFPLGYATLPAGMTWGYKIYMPITGVSGAPGTSFISTSLGSSTNFSWTDTAGGATIPQTTNNATYLLNYPTNTSVIHN